MKNPRILLLQVLVLITFSTLRANPLIDPNYFIDAELENGQMLVSSVESLNDKNTFHLFSHGRPGELLIEGEWKNAEQIVAFFKQAINRQPSTINHINIYGCEFAKGEKGLEAVKYLEEHLGIKISASDDITGKDGDWELEIGSANNNISVLNYEGNLQLSCSPDYGIVPGPTNQYAITSSGGLSGATAGAGAPNGSGIAVYSSGATYQGIFTYANVFSGGSTIVITARYIDTRTDGITLEFSTNNSTWVSLTPVINGFTSSYTDVSYTLPSILTGQYKYIRVRGVSSNTYLSIDAIRANVAVCNTCPARLNAPVLSAGEVSVSCPSQTYNLNTITASNMPANTELTWHTGTPATDANKVMNAVMANGEVYYAAFHSIANGCYSGINGSATTQVKINRDFDCDGILNSSDIDDDNDGIPDNFENITTSCGDGTGRVIEWDWEDEKTQSSSYVYFANKPEYRPLAGPGITLLGAGGAWRMMNIDNNGTLSSAIALGEYVSGQFTVREKGIYVNGWAYFQINNTGSTTQPKMGILIDEDPNFGSPAIVSDGVAAIQPYGSITYPDGFSRTLAHVSNPTYLYPNTTYYVRFYDLKTNGFNDVSHDEIGLVFEEASGGAEDCGGGDIDNDGIVNRLDLDSDGDGCPDAIEGSGTFTQANIQNIQTVNPTYTGGNSGVGYTGSSNDPVFDYLGSTSNAQGSPIVSGVAVQQGIGYSREVNFNYCIDTDGDGTPDVEDRDDDNDGIVDAVESPDCFYTSAEAGTIAAVSTPLPNDDGVNVNLPFMHDGVTTTVTASNNVITLNQAVNGAVIYNIEYPTPVRITSISHYGTTFGTNATAKIQGSNDNATWDELMTAATAAAATNPRTFTVNNNAANNYRYYRIVKVAGTSTPAVTTYEISVVQNTTGYIPSSHPKPICDNDPDGDGINNHQDLDSDGDGCSDLVEASVSPDDDVTDAGAENNEGGSWGIDDPAGAQLNPAGTDANNDGLNDSVDVGRDGQTDYTSTYYFAEIPELNACLDTDGDGVRDVFDLDDDNDGVLDKTEQICSNNDYNTNSSSGIDNIFSRYGLTTETLYDQLADDIGLIFSLSPAFSSGISLNNAICSQPNLYGGDYNSTVWIKSVNPEEITVPVPLHSISLKNDCQGNNEILSYTAYDINGLVLYTYNIVANQPHIANQKIDLVMDPNYDVYRISIERSADAMVVVGVTLKDGNGFLMCDLSTDTDGDGIPNHLDLDSDNDGCPDLAEAGVSPSPDTDVTDAAATNNEGGEWGADNLTGAQLDINGTDANNDGLNDSVDPGQDGQTDYASTYTQYAMANNLNTCADTDNDSIKDLTDIDDDNDGVLDAEESPDCFYTQAEAGVISTITSQFSSPDDDQTDGDIQLLHDGSTTATFNFSGVAAASNPTGSNIFTIEFPTAVKLATLTVSDNLSTTTNSNAVIVGSNDGVTWSSALSPSTIITTTPITFTITATQEYKYYKIRTGSVASNLLTGDTIGEITVVLATGYIPSAHPKPDCSNDTDNDGVFNHHDLDSDGDGCPDAVETETSDHAGVTSPGNLVNSPADGGNQTNVPNAVVGTGVPADYGNNGFYNAIEDPAESGHYTGSYVFYYYSLEQIINVCKDSDGDGDPDYIDLDDDNDGVLNHIESPLCFFQDWEVIDIESITSQLTIENATRPFTNAIDGVDNTTSYTGIATGQNSEGKAVYTITLPTYTAVSSIQFSMHDSPFGNANVTFMLQGSNGAVGTGGWVNLESTAKIRTVTNGIQTFTVDAMYLGRKYKRYRIVGVNDIAAANNSTAFARVKEIYINLYHFNPSDYPKPGPCLDFYDDGDMIPAYLDLDSDGDMCSDAYEAGATTITTPNYQFPNIDNNNDGLVDIVDDGSNGEVALDGYPDYMSTYVSYAIKSWVNACMDSDDDGIKDVDDIDDDNDGITDIVERNCSEPQTIFDFNSNKQNWIETQGAAIGNLYHSSDPPISGCASIPPSPTGTGFIASFDNIVGYANFNSGSTNLNMNLSYALNRTLSFQWINEIIQSNGIQILKALRVELAGGGKTVSTYFNVAGINDDGWHLIEIPLTVEEFGSADLINVLADLDKITIEVESMRDGNGSGCSTGVEFFALDDITIGCEVAEDFDNDGVINRLDLDSDGDGCPDMREAGVYRYAINNNVEPAPEDGEVTNGNGTDTADNTMTTVDNSQFHFLSPENDMNGNGFVDGLETNMEGQYNDAYNLVLYMDPLQGNCVCYKVPSTGTALPSIDGITTLSRRNKETGEWENMPANAFLVLESKEKGFVITRMPDPESTITGEDAVKGMLVYDTDDNCLKMYDGTSWFCLQQGCPE